jgi:hypothetical protein
MTAINPARLKIQCAELAALYQHPDRFTTGLHDLLGFYGARIRQTSLSKAPLTLQAYQIPAPVMRGLVLELGEKLASQPEAGLALVDALWKSDWMEFRQLAVLCLGNLPVKKTQQVLSRIRSWLDSCTVESIRILIMEAGLGRLIETDPKQVLNFLSGLIASGTKNNHQAALFGMAALTERAGFENLPLILKMLQDVLSGEETGLVKEITSLIRSLQQQSDQETAYFLVRQLGTAARPRIFRVVRGILNRFSPESQALLKEALHTYS